MPQCVYTYLHTCIYASSGPSRLDLIQIWRYIKKQGNLEMADHVESVIWIRLFFWRRTQVPDIGAKL